MGRRLLKPSHRIIHVCGSKIFVLTVFYIPLVHKWLEVAAVFDAIRRIEIDHLRLAAHALFLL